jgi:thiol-disulfide isomerase/thioredoxin
LETSLLEKVGLGRKTSSVAVAGSDLPVEGTLPPLTGAVQWLNSPPLTPAGLRGKVVLVDFWTYSCINCLRALPYVEAWAKKYAASGLVVIGVHAPEFAFEKDPANVKRAVHDLGVTYPVALDNNLAIWNAFNNQYWPAHYFIDVQGRIRHHHFGEGEYDASEKVIQQLLREAGRTNVPGGIVDPKATGAQAVDAAIGPEIDQHDLALQLGAGERRRVQPCDRARQFGHLALDGKIAAGHGGALRLASQSDLFEQRLLHAIGARQRQWRQQPGIQSQRDGDNTRQHQHAQHAANPFARPQR